MATGVNDHPHSGWLGFYRHRREKTGARSAPIVAGLENPISRRDFLKYSGTAGGALLLEVVSKPQIRFKGPAEAGLHV